MVTRKTDRRVQRAARYLCPRAQPGSRCPARGRQYRCLPALWSSEILAELDRTLRMLLSQRGVSDEETDAYLTRLLRQMETAFPDALVTDWE